MSIGKLHKTQWQAKLAGVFTVYFTGMLTGKYISAYPISSESSLSGCRLAAVIGFDSLY